MKRKCLSLAALVVAVILSTVPATSAQEWGNDPYFIDPEVEGIKFTDTTGPSGNLFHLYMDVDEEIPWPFDLAILNYQGSNTPQIGKFLVGNQNLLPTTKFERNPDGYWVLMVTGRLDYEQMASHTISFEITVPGIEFLYNPRITMNVINIFDNAPRLDSSDRCEIDELLNPQPYLTDCSYTLFSDDGLAGNSFTFEINGENKEEDLFEFVAVADQTAKSREYRLQTKKTLLFVERELYSFTVNVKDAGNPPNVGTARIIVEVKDVPSEPPKWTKSFVSDRFDEKSPTREYTVVAIDGDTQINKRINYALAFENEEEEWTTHFSIGQEDGILKVTTMNRDYLKQEVFNFEIIAYKFDNISWDIRSTATIILNDINDNWPEITLAPKVIEIWEATFETLPFENFMVNDIDLALNAQYNVELTETELATVSYSKAFTIVPPSGYQEANFFVSVIDAASLDYEDEIWRTFDVRVRSVEKIDSSHFREETFTVELKNWNDEEPIFQNLPYAFTVNETVENGALLGAVLATDRDVGDKVEYSIVGYLSEQITIDEEGKLYSNAEELLDYDRQKSVVIQIAAKDTLRTEKPGEVLHTTYQQVTINVEDVNNKTPELRMPRISPSILENSDGGTVVTAEIEATDTDTTADLVLEILWEESYATKYGRRVDQVEYRDCFIIEADQTNKNKVIGTIKVNPEFLKLRQVDYEKFEVLYLTIHVTDKNTEVGVPDTKSVITVQIEDENDCAPVFQEADNVVRTVIEESLVGTVIGSVLATDEDGPGFNEVRYRIESLGDTPDWVSIGEESGVLTVASKEINCDIPPREYLNYRIIATDSLWETPLDISIYIFDTNNRIPAFVDFVDTVSIYEDQEDGLVIAIKGSDLDRDLQFRDLKFQIDYSGNLIQRDLFTIETVEDTGTLIVKLENGMKLDRDNGVTQHVISVVVTDNQGLGFQNQYRDLVTVVLLDVNDNAPVLPSPSNYQPKISENFFAGFEEPREVVDYRLIATDKDEGVNAEVSFKILSITAYEGTANPPPSGIEDLFEIKSERTINRGTLIVKKSLQGLYGTWEIVIEAYDHGDEGYSQISLKTQETYLLTIEPFNFNVPKIRYPIADQTLRMRYPPNVNGQLYQFNGNPLPDFVADDLDGGVFGQVEFMVTGSANDNDHELFKFVQSGTNQYQLQVSQGIEDRIYHINIAAVDGGDLREEISDLRIVFVNQDGNPVFSPNSVEIEMLENDPTATAMLPPATDPKNEGVTDPTELYPIYYFLSGTSPLFSVDKDTGVLSLKQALEWTPETESYEIVVIATNVASGPINPDANSMLTVKIHVKDVRYRPPVFEVEKYGAGITTDDPVGKIVLKVKAVDKDKDDVVSYRILTDTMEASPSLSNIKDNAFEMVSGTDPGELKLLIKMQDSYSGYFTFTVQATDLADLTDEAQVRVYIIAESNRVSFIFKNTLEEVEEHRNYIADVLSRFFEFDCFVDDVQPYDDGNGSIKDSIEVRAHFVDKDSIAVEGDVIRARTNEIGLITEISVQMFIEGLNLFEIPGTGVAEEVSNKENLLKILLISVTCVFALLLGILIVAFIFRTRSLNRQLKAYSASDIVSSLPRKEAPTSNVFSVEKMNPAAQNNNQLRKTMFDEESIQSDDSDMIGFEDLPEFQKDYQASNGIPTDHNESLNVARIKDIRQNSLNPMANGGGETLKSYDSLGVNGLRF